MKITCECGHLLSDNTDKLPYKAHFISDQDWDAFWDAIDEAIENPGRAANDREARCMQLRRLQLFRRAWQCPTCGRLFVDDQGYNLNVFLPNSTETSRTILASK
jgi:hypothetical protein